MCIGLHRRGVVSTRRYPRALAGMGDATEHQQSPAQRGDRHVPASCLAGARWQGGTSGLEPRISHATSLFIDTHERRAHMLFTRAVGY